MLDLIKEKDTIFMSSMMCFLVLQVLTVLIIFSVQHAVY